MSAHLGHADLGLFSDPVGTRVAIPHLMSLTETPTAAGVDVQFEGDTYPTPFDGPARTRSFEGVCRYGAHEHDQLLALIDLVERVAAAAPDKRLLPRTHLGLVPGLDSAVAVRIRSLPRTPQGAGIIDVHLRATVVEHTFQVV